MYEDELEPHEFLRISRKRRGLTIPQMAKDLGLSRFMYLEWESGRRPYQGNADWFKVPAAGELGFLEKGEQCTILRRRAGKKIKDVAPEFGRCAFTVSKMEDGRSDATALLEFWHAKQSQGSC